MAANFKNLLDKGIASVTVKSSTFLETSKLSNQINIAEAEIPNQKKLMADAAYRAWCEQSSVDEVIVPYCEEIKALERQIADLQKKISDIKEESLKTLGAEAAKNDPSAAAAGNVSCPACGAENVGGARFCCKCGNKIE